jgi:hypothetical protein
VRVLHVIAIVEPGGGLTPLKYYNHVMFYYPLIVFRQILIVAGLGGFPLGPGSLISQPRCYRRVPLLTSWFFQSKS